jgi:hypothetical protein
MSWRLANSLVKLRNQVNAAYPKRNKASDGTIGDTPHQAVASDHNPNFQGVVTALDLTHHSGYFNAHALADRLIKYRHPNLEYVISNNRIAGPWTNWKWEKYSGSNPHTRHIHISVGDDRPDGQARGNYDSTQAWNIKGTGSKSPVPKTKQPTGGKKVTKSEATKLVTALYVRLLKRKPDTAGLNNYVRHVLNGRYDFVVSDIAGSDEFKKKNVKTVTKTVTKRVKDSESIWLKVKKAFGK